MGQLFFKKALQTAIREGRKRTTIRRWREGKPGVKPGQRAYSPGLGWLAIETVDAVDMDELSDTDALADGFDTASAMRALLKDLYPDIATDGKAWFRVSFSVDNLHPERKKRTRDAGECHLF